MKDFTQGSILRHVLAMAGPIAAIMIAQILYQLVDLYFVSNLGDAAVAGVAAGSGIALVVMAFTQILNISVVALMAQAVGRKETAAANLLFNQSLVLAVLCSVLTLLVGSLSATPYMRLIAADAATIAAGASYLQAFMPGLALQFPLVTMSAALRANGNMRLATLVQVMTVMLNAILAPILISGWLTGHAMGVQGAGVASSIAIATGVLVLGMRFHRAVPYLAIERALLPVQTAQWRRIFAIGLPASGEFAFLFVFAAVNYYVIRDFGAVAQAGFGLGSRVMQAIQLPAMAIAFAAAPIAAQNVGARNGDRVRETLRTTMLVGTCVMIVATALAHWRPQALVALFPADAATLAVAALFLQLISWNFVAQGVIYTCSGLFQAFGNTLPALISSAFRVAVFAIPAIWMSTRSGFRMEHVWYWAIVATTLQALFSVYLLRREFGKRLASIADGAPAANESAPALMKPGRAA